MEMENVSENQALCYERKSLQGVKSYLKVILFEQNKRFFRYQKMDNAGLSSCVLREISSEEYLREISRYQNRPQKEADHRIVKERVPFAQVEGIFTKYLGLDKSVSFKQFLEQNPEMYGKKLKTKFKFSKEALRKGYSKRNIMAFNNDMPNLNLYYASLKKAANRFDKMSADDKSYYRQEILKESVPRKGRALFDLGVEFGAVNPAKIDLGILVAKLKE